MQTYIRTLRVLFTHAHQKSAVLESFVGLRSRACGGVSQLMRFYCESRKKRWSTDEELGFRVRNQQWPLKGLLSMLADKITEAQKGKVLSSQVVGQPKTHAAVPYSTPVDVCLPHRPATARRTREDMVTQKLPPSFSENVFGSVKHESLSAAQDLLYSSRQMLTKRYTLQNSFCMISNCKWD